MGSKALLRKIENVKEKMKGSYFIVLMGYELNDALPDSMTGFETLGEFVSYAINFAIGLAALLAVIVLIYNGIMYIVSGGDEAKVETATRGITYAIIGLILCFVSKLVIDFILVNLLRVPIS